MILSGIASWAHVQKPSKEVKLDDGKVIESRYSIDLILDIETAKKLKKEGYNIKRLKADVSGIPDSEGMPYIQIKKRATFRDGNPTPKPEVVDAKKKPFDGLVGNGSKVNVVFAPVPWEAFGTKGIAANLRKVQVVELVEFKNADSLEDFDEVDGFTADGDKKEANNTIDDLDF